MLALTKADMAEHLHAKVGLNRSEAKEVVEELFESIRGVLAEGEPVKVSGFGNFTLRDKKERPGRNPKTGEAKVVKARRVVSFRAGRKLKLRVQDYGRHNIEEGSQSPQGD